jgi:transposase
MPYAKYTREVLSEAVASSTSMAGVLRNLGLRQNGGAHAHVRRRIDQLGIDRSHFLGRAHYRGAQSPRRRSPSEILVLRPVDAKRAAPPVLRRALVELGRAYRCAECGVGDTWNGRPLTLHIDHIDGQFWDCRPDNLRFLCANCHSQTATYAGRNRQWYHIAAVRVDEDGNAVDGRIGPAIMTEVEKIDVLGRVDAKELTVADAARLIGCHRSHVYQLRRRLKERGSLAPAKRQPRMARAVREAVVAFALQNPHLGTRRLASELARRHADPICIAHGTVANILKAAGLNTERSRRSAAAAQSTSKRTV